MYRYKDRKIIVQAKGLLIYDNVCPFCAELVIEKYPTNGMLCIYSGIKCELKLVCRFKTPNRISTISIKHSPGDSTYL